MVRFFVKLEGQCRVKDFPYVTEGKVYPATPAGMTYTPATGLTGLANIIDDQDDEITIGIGSDFECYHINGRWIIVNPEE